MASFSCRYGTTVFNIKLNYYHEFIFKKVPVYEVNLLENGPEKGCTVYERKTILSLIESFETLISCILHTYIENQNIPYSDI